MLDFPKQMEGGNGKERIDMYGADKQKSNFISKIAG